MLKVIRLEKFWYYYLIVRLFYLVFALLIYARLTTLGDTWKYMSAPLSSLLSPTILINSTDMMEAIGSVFGILGGSNIITNLPFTLLSFLTIKWVIDKYEFRKYINNYILFILLSLPNFCIWTSICSKETIGLIFSAILGSLIIDYFNGVYKIKKNHYLGFYLCLLFKPQYLPFILQGLVFIYIVNKYAKSNKAIFFIGLFFIFCNLSVLYLIRDIINQYASIMYYHFDDPNANSTRDNIWLYENDFFYEAPKGMFVAFFGPTIDEMLSNPAHFIAGTESIILITLLSIISYKFILRVFIAHKISLRFIFALFIIITGIALLHYPFGIFNPGSAIRYRTNFVFIFILLFLYLNKFYTIKK